MDGSAFGPQVHPIHRVIPGVAAGQLAERSAAGMAVEEQSSTDADPGWEQAQARLAACAGAAYLIVGDGRCWLISQPDPAQPAAALGDTHSEAWSALDVSVLHGYVVPTLWNLDDHEDTVGYEHDVAAALATAARTGGTAVLLKPTPVDAVTAVAAQGERMPRKSTLFTPKPRTGLLVRDYRDDPGA